jgi:hypothetical protein
MVCRQLLLPGERNEGDAPDVPSHCVGPFLERRAIERQAYTCREQLGSHHHLASRPDARCCVDERRRKPSRKKSNGRSLSLGASWWSGAGV